MDFAEITEKAFKLIFTDEPIEIDELELVYVERFIGAGMYGKTIYNHVSATTQYYIRDINA